MEAQIKKRWARLINDSEVHELAAPQVPYFFKQERHMARLTYKASASDHDQSGPAALGNMIVAYWESVRNKDQTEVEMLTASLKSDLTSLFAETSSGEVEIQLVHDTNSVVHIPVAVPADDLQKYKAEGFAEALGHAMIMGCGRSPKLRLEKAEPALAMVQAQPEKSEEAA
jgi:hypothetical protein